MVNKSTSKPGEFDLKTGIQNHVWIEVNLSALTHNLDVIRREVGPKVNVMGIVKSNAYGHGISEVARYLCDRVDFLGVADLNEAAHLRNIGIQSPLLIFGYIFPQDLEECLEKNVSVTISSLEQAKALSQRAEHLGKLLKVHVKVDTGMGRMGILADEAKEMILTISQLPNLVLEGLMTHFSVADSPENPFTVEQIEKFDNIVNYLERKGIYILYIHAANSAGIFGFKKSHFNMVRPGISVYGIHPTCRDKKKNPLIPVLSLKTKVHLIKKLPKGHSVSYGRNFRMPEDGYIAVLSIGYGHGYAFALSEKSRVLIGGKSYPVCGNVCMDYTLVHLGQRHEIKTGDEVVLIGSQGNESISAEELAQLSGTIPYEVLTRLAQDIERWYVE